MLNARMWRVAARNPVVAIAMVVLGAAAAVWLASSASAAPIVVPWASDQNFAAATAVVGIEPNQSAATTNWGPAVTFSIANGASFTTIPYTQGVFDVSTSSSTPSAYDVNAATYPVGSLYPDGVNHNPPNVGGSIQPAHASPKNVTGVGIQVGSSVTYLSGGINGVSDPYFYGTKLTLTNTNNPNYFVPGANAAIIAGNFVSTGSSLTMQWRSRSQTEMDKGAGTANILPTAAGYLASDVMKMSGMQQGYDYVLQMDFSNAIETPGDQFYDIQANKGLYLGELINNGTGRASWRNAVYQNVATVSPSWTNQPAVGPYAWQGPGYQNYGAVPGAPSNVPYIGSFQQFLSTNIRPGRPGTLLLRTQPRPVARHMGHRHQHRHRVGGSRRRQRHFRRGA